MDFMGPPPEVPGYDDYPLFLRMPILSHRAPQPIPQQAQPKEDRPRCLGRSRISFLVFHRASCMDIGPVSSSSTALPMHEASGIAMVSQPLERTQHSAFIDLGGMSSHRSPSTSTVRSYGGPIPGLPANVPLHYCDFLMGGAPPPSQMAPLIPELSIGTFTPKRVDLLKGMPARVSALERELRDMTAGFHGVGRCYLRLQDEVGDVYDAIRVVSLYPALQELAP